MMDKNNLRRADLFTGALLFAFGLWMCLVSFKMPMKDSFGGVQNVWYVSPALLPLIIGFSLMLLSLLLIINSAKQTGFAWIAKEAEKKLSTVSAGHILSDKSMRFIAILTAFIAFVFLNIPRIDFFLSSWLFLLFFITMFYFDSNLLLVRLLKFYGACTFLFLLYFLFKLDNFADGIYYFMTDVFALCFIVAYTIFTAFAIKGNAELKRKFRSSLVVAVVVPLILCPVFKYFLLVPLPKEGLVIEGIMDMIKYSLF